MEHERAYVIRDSESRFFFDDGTDKLWWYSTAAIMSKEKADFIIDKYGKGELVQVG